MQSWRVLTKEGHRRRGGAEKTTLPDARGKEAAALKTFWGGSVKSVVNNAAKPCERCHAPARRINVFLPQQCLVVAHECQMDLQ
jgi:hypothetical protein